MLSRPALPAMVRVTDCRLSVSPDRWHFAAENWAAIETHWKRRQSEAPALFNGDVFLLSEARIEEGVLLGSYLAANFASYLYWRETGFSDQTVCDAFGCVMVAPADGGWLVARAADGCLNEGLDVFPGGLIDPRDIRETVHGRLIDVGAGAMRELQEESGLQAGELTLERGFQIACCGPLVGYQR